jgi:type IV pilus assembly protein PilM
MAFGLSSVTDLFKKDSKPSSPKEVFLGVDIGSSAIKIVQIKYIKGIPTLETYGELQLGPYDCVDIGRNTRLPSDKLIEACVDIMREANITGTQVAVAFPYNASFTHVISVPTRNVEKIPSILPIEARKYIPASLSKVVLDWIPLNSEDETNTTNTTKILLSAIYTQEIQKYEEVMRGAILEMIAGEIEIFSSLRSTVSPKDEVVGIIDCGASSTRLYIIEKGILRETHSVPLSGVEITNSISKILGIDFIEAEEIKRTKGLGGLAKNVELQKALTNSLERGFRELHMVMTQYEHDNQIQIQKIILSGGGSLLRGIDVYAHDMFSRPITQALPFEKLAYPAFLEDTLKEAGPSFAVAVGVALRGIQNSK